MCDAVIRFVDRVVAKLGRVWRNAVFRARTKQQANIVGPCTIINTNLSLGKGVTLYPGVMIFGDGPVVVGDGVDIGKDTVIYSSRAGGGVHIGAGTAIAAQCYIIDMDHGLAAGRPVAEQQNSVSPVTIGGNVWIAANCTILRGSVIGDGAVVGAKSLVKGVLEPEGIYVGSPARLLRKKV